MEKGDPMDFKKGDFVIYGTHGRCEITAIETKSFNNAEEMFYELTPVNPGKNDSRFLIPVSSAKQNGVRQEIDQEDAKIILDTLSSSEFFLKVDMPWPQKEKEIENMVRFQGALGLAKAVKHLYIYHESVTFPEPIATRTYKKLFKVLAREISQAKQMTIKDTELMLLKALTTKVKKTN